MGGVYVAVGKHDVVHSFVDGFFRLLAEGCQCFLQSLAPFCHFEEQGQFHGLEAFVPDVAENIQLGVVQDGMVQPHHLAMVFAGCQYVHAYGSDVFGQQINMNDFKYVFGPIPSRRLGRSLGISPLPKKTCNYSCIYCQLGRTDKMTNKRQEFYKTEDIIAEFKQYLKDSDKFDIVTVVGEGEPTLAANLGELVVALKALTDKPVAVITNGALLSDPQVREELCHADMVLPSLDAYNQEISKKIDRPYGTIKFEEEFEGLKKFTHMYEGELWLEIMLVDGINDDEQSILKFQELLKELKYDRLYLNTPVRPPAEADVNVVSEERMRYAVETLGGISIEMMSSGAFFSEIEDDYEAVKSIIGRHPMNQFEVRGFLESRDVKDPEAMMEQMKKDEAIHVIDYKGILTFRLK